jgi:hypothetical protein
MAVGHLLRSLESFLGGLPFSRRGQLLNLPAVAQRAIIM